jgi:N-acetylglucosaminyldiphosphoundecaprenol N-acetyl-beta-D-mannosaminyltransferase
MLRLSELSIVESKDALKDIPEGKVLINTINAHSFNTALKDDLFAEALRTVDGGELRVDSGQLTGDRECVKYLIPDGASIIQACKFLKAKSRPKERIAGWDLFAFEMERVKRRSKREEGRGKVMFMGSSEKVLALIKEKAAVDYPNLDVVTYSPPYKPEFSDEDNAAIIKAINEADPDLLWIGMTAPKQEKWTYSHWKELNIHCHVGTIGAVFDFYAGTAKRAPQWWQDHSLEWLYRLCIEPKRMWRRYLLGNPLFVWNVIKELRVES